MGAVSMGSIMVIVLIHVKKRPHGKHPIKSEFDSMIEIIHGGSLLMCSELVEENLILQNLGIKESKWLVIHEHCIRNINQIDQGVGNQQLCVSVLNRSGKETNNNIFLPFLLSTNWII